MSNRKRWLVWLFVLVIVQCFLPEEYVQAQGEPKTVAVSSWVHANGPNTGQFTVTVPEEQEGVSEGEFNGYYLVEEEIQVEVTVPAGYDMKYLQVTNISFEISELNVDFQKKEENVYTFTLTPQDDMSIQLQDTMYQNINIDNRSMMRYKAYSEDTNSYVKTGEDCTIVILDAEPDNKSTLYLVINGEKQDTDSLQWEDVDGKGECRYTLRNVQDSVEVIVADQDSTISHSINLPEGFELYDEEGNQLDKTGSMFQLTGKFGQPFTFLVKGTEEDLNYELYYSTDDGQRIVLEAEPTKYTDIYAYTVEDAVKGVYINTEMLDAVRLTGGADIKMILCDEDGTPLDENDKGRTVFYMKPDTISYFKLAGTAGAYYIIEDSWGAWIIPEETEQGEFIYSVSNFGWGDLELTLQAKNRVYLGDGTGVYGDIDWNIAERSDWDEDENQFYYMPYSFETTLFIPEEYVLGDDIELAAHDMDGRELFRIAPKEMEYRSSEGGYYCTFAIEDLKVTAWLLIEGADVGVSQILLYDEEAFDDVRIRILDADNQEVLPDEDEEYCLVNDKPYRLCLSGNNLEDVTVLYCGEKLKTVVEGRTLEAEFTAGREYCISLVRGNTYPVAVEAPDCAVVCRRDGMPADGFQAEGKLYFYVHTMQDASAMTIIAKDESGQAVPVTKTEETVRIQIGEDLYEEVDLYAVDVSDSLTIVVEGIEESYTCSVVLPKSTASMQISPLYALDYDDDYAVAGKEIEGQTNEDESITYLTNSSTDNCEGYLFYITAEEEASLAVKRTDIWRDIASERHVSLRKESTKECDEGKAVWRCVIFTEDTALGTRIVLEASDQATKVVLREKNGKGWVRYWNSWSYSPEREEDSDEIFELRNLSDALLDNSKDTVFELRSGEYFIAEKSLGEFFTAYREENGEGKKLPLKQTEDGIYSCTLPAGYSIIEFDADKLEKKQYRVTLDNTYGENVNIELFSSFWEDEAYEPEADGTYLTDDWVCIKITADNETLDMLKLNCDGEDNWLNEWDVDGDGEEEEGYVWYYLHLYTDTTLHISKASSVRLENAAGVTLKSTSFKGSSAAGLASGMPVTIKVVAAEGYQADTVTLKHIYKENGAQKEDALEISDGSAEVTLAPGENRIVAGAPEKQSCRITMPEDDAYTAAPVSGYGPTVKYGEDYKFTVRTAEGYDAETLVVRANGEVLEAGADGVYTIENIKKDVNVRIMLDGLTLVEFHNDTEHVTLTGNSGKAEAGTAVSFTVAVDAGYRADSVKAYHTYYENREKKTVELTVTNGAGNVVLKAGENDITVTAPEKQTYQVVLPTGTGYTAKLYGGSSLTVPYMESMSFKVKADSGYDTQTIVVTVNGKVLEVARGGVYTIENITEDCTVAIAIEKIEEEEPDKPDVPDTPEEPDKPDVPDIPEKPEKAVVYTVTFKGADGKVLKEEKVETGKAASAPTAPDRTGYTFTGWDKSFDKVTTDMTVTAVYKQVLVKEIKISGISKKIAAGKSVTLTAGLAPENALVTDVEWSTSNSKYATVDQKGKVKTKKAGAGKKVTITAQAKDGSGVKASYVIQIQKKAVSTIRLSAKTKTVKAGKKLSIKAKVSPAKNVNKTLLWTSSNTKYATVSQKGVVTTKKAGAGKKVTITAKATDGSGKKASIKIKIKK